MSYRDIKNFCEMTRVLGYPRLISIENFRQPNFQLLAELLKWLVKRYDPQTDIPIDTDTEQDRILFIKSVAQFMATKAHIKLNTKKLYQADGYVVKELLKMTSLLYNALKLNPDENSEEFNNANVSTAFDISSQIADIKCARELASEITAKGSTIHDLLSNEVELREMRTYTINRNLELSDVERGIRDAIRACQREGEKISQMLENIHSDEKNLDEKIEKKRSDLERHLKRLRTLKDVRPAFMDEYEILEKELEEYYQKYLVKFRIQAFLEQQLDEYNRSEQEKIGESAKAMQILVKKSREREKELFGNPLNDEDDIVGVTSSESEQMDDNDKEKSKKFQINKREESSKVKNATNKAVIQKSFGKMGEDISDSSDNVQDGLDDDEDDEDDDDDDEDQDDDDDDGITDSEVEKMEQARMQQHQQQMQQQRNKVAGTFSSDRTAAELATRGGKIAQRHEESDSDF